MTKKKILFVITKSNWGGAQRYVYDLATHLPKIEFDAAVVSGNRGMLTEKLEQERIRSICIDNLKRDISLVGELLSFFRILKIIREEKPEVLHLNSSKAAGLGALAGQIAGVRKIIFTVHGWPFEEERSVLAKMLIYIASWLTTLLSHATIVLTRADEAQGRKFLFRGNKIIRIPIGIEPSYEILPADEAREVLYRDTAAFDKEALAQKRIIGSNGELTKNKGYEYALQALVQLKREGITDFLYLVISDGEDRAKLENRARALGLTGEVLFLGFVPDVRRLLKAFDVFLLPSLKEGLPYAILEAGLAELPVVASNAGGVPDVINDEGNGLLCPKKDPRAIAKALTEVLNDPGRLGHNLRAKVLRDFSFAGMFEKTLTLYQS